MKKELISQYFGLVGSEQITFFIFAAEFIINDISYTALKSIQLFSSFLFPNRRLKPFDFMKNKLIIFIRLLCGGNAICLVGYCWWKQNWWLFCEGTLLLPFMVHAVQWPGFAELCCESQATALCGACKCRVNLRGSIAPHGFARKGCKCIVMTL